MKRGERGSAVLVVIVVGFALAATGVAATSRARGLMLELRARHEVMCARYAALSGLALGETGFDERAAAALVSPEVDALRVQRLRRGPAWCVLRSEADCGQAHRIAERTLTAVGACE